MSPWFRSKAREEAGAALRSAGDTLAALESGAADLRPARRLRDRAEALARRGAYRESIEAARNAEEAAKLLDRLHTAASRGLARLRSERSRMGRLGIGVEDVDRLVADAESWMSRTIERDGDPEFPAYSKAAELALRGLRLSKERVPKFKAATAAVDEAERALRSMIEANRFVDRDAFEFFALKPATEGLEEAKGRLRANAFEEARDLARWTLATATQIRESYGRVTAAFARVDDGVRALRSEGGVAMDVEQLLAICRAGLEQGKFAEASRVAEQAARRLEEVRETYRSLVLRLRNAEDAIQQVETWGFDASEPRAILEEARGLLEAGRYEEAGPRLDEARRTAQGLRETHKAAAARIAEMRRSVAATRSVSPSAAEEAEGLLARAEALLEEGRYRACEEDLQIASLLLVDPGAARGAAGPMPAFASILQAAQAVQPTCTTCGGPLANDGTCPTCSAIPEPENAPARGAIVRAMEDARKVIEEIGREDRTLAGVDASSVGACAACGRPLGGEEVLCARCQALVKGRA